MANLRIETSRALLAGASLAAAVLVAEPAAAQPVEVALATAGDTVIAGSPGVTVADHQVAGTDRAGFYQTELAALSAALPPAASIDALDFVSPAEAYFSLDAPAVLGGMLGPELFAAEDVIAWNGSSFAMLWDGSANGVPAHADLDALDVGAPVPLQVFLSLDVPTVLGGLGLVADEDIVEHRQGSGFVAVAFDGSAEGVAASADLNAFNRRGTAEWLLSFDAAATVGPLAYDDGDLVLWNALTGIFDPSPWFVAAGNGVPSGADLEAAEATPGQVPVELLYFAVE